MRRWQFWIGLLISAVFLFFALRKVDFAAAWRHVLTAQWGFLLVGWLCLLISYAVRVWRWHVIVSPIARISPSALGQVYMAGLMSNNILPARMGEVVRAYLLGQTAQVSAASALGTIAVERVFDVLMALVLLVVGATFGVLASVGSSVWLGSVLVAGLIAGILVLTLWGEPLSNLLERLVGRFSPLWGKRLADLGRSFVEGLRSVGSVGRALQLGLWSAAAWGLFMVYASFFLRAYGLRISIPGAAFLLGVGGLGVSIPSAPGSVGTLEGAYMFALQLLGIGDQNSRVSFALTYHVFEWITTCSIGLFCLARLGLSLGQLSEMVSGTDA